MPQPRARRLEFAITVDGEGRVAAEASTPAAIPDAWTPEHLLLAALARCSLASLRYHARRAGLAVEATASSSGAVTRREEDGRYAFVEIVVDLDVRLDPAPEHDRLAELLARAERDCFVGASLSVAPTYRWRVDGEDAL